MVHHTGRMLIRLLMPMWETYEVDGAKTLDDSSEDEDIDDLDLLPDDVGDALVLVLQNLFRPGAILHSMNLMLTWAQWILMQ
ncbi:hypothetical protein GQ457_06G016360 [Hibiscus cannabinus]